MSRRLSTIDRVVHKMYSANRMTSRKVHDPEHPMCWNGLRCWLGTKRRDGEACIGNQKLEQETTKGTHSLLDLLA